MLGLDDYESSDDEEEVQRDPFMKVRTWKHEAQQESSRSLLMTEIAEEPNQRARAAGSTGRWCVRGRGTYHFDFI